jgi:mRNA interferase HigB
VRVPQPHLHCTAAWYRLIVAFKFSAKVAFIKFLGTHAQYDRIQAATVSRF